MKLTLPKNELTQDSSQSRLAAWLLILGIILIATNLRAPITAVGPVIGEIRDQTGISNTLAGILTTLPLLAFAILSPFAPKIARRIGVEYTLLAGMIILTIGIVFRSTLGITALFLGTALVGLGISVCNVLVPSLIKREFPEQVGLMTGVYSVSMNLPGALASGLSIPIAHKLGFGWSGALGCWAILSFIAIITWLPQLQKKHKPNNSATNQFAGHLWRSRLAWMVTIYMGLQSLLFYVLVAWLPEILQQKMSIDTAGWMLSIVQFVILPVTFIVPILAGRSPNQRLLVIISASSSLVGCAGLLSGNFSLILLWVILLGIGAGSSFSLAMMFFVLRTTDAQQAAELSGMAQSVGYLLAATGPTLFGFIHDLTNGWTIPLITLIIIAILTMIIGLNAGSSGYVLAKDK